MTWRLLIAALALAACNDKGAEGEGEGEGEGEAVQPVCTEPTDLVCTDALISDLAMHDEVSEGAVTESEEDGSFVTLIDASAGGYSRYTQNPWVYIKFTENGAQKVEITDEDSLESMDWDLSARRFILRLNGGDSGPSCVGASALLESDYDDVSTESYEAIADQVIFAPDDYYTDDCTFVNDSSGLPDSPQTALGAYWSYSACVAMTDVPFLVQLADGHVIKLRVETYYKTDQDICDTEDKVPSDGGYITLRWSWLK